jgi:hypothetical protein
VSFLVVSTTVFLEVSFLVVSTVVVLLESTVLVESVVEVEEEPLQAAKDTAIAKAKEAILNEFFMCYILFVALIQQNEKGNP